jgi:hypothetical protein
VPAIFYYSFLDFITHFFLSLNSNYREIKLNFIFLLLLVKTTNILQVVFIFAYRVKYLPRKLLTAYMAFSLCIPRTASWANSDLVSILFERAFNNGPDKIIQSIVMHERIDFKTKEKYNTFFIYFHFISPQLYLIRETILENGLTQFIFGQRFSTHEFAIIRDSTLFKPDHDQHMFIWLLTF